MRRTFTKDIANELKIQIIARARARELKKQR